LALLLAAAIPAQIVAQVAAQTVAPAGSLSGRLTDLHSKPIDGATVALRNTQTGAEVQTVTQKNGTYHFKDVPAGEYTLAADSERFGHGSLQWIVVSAGAEAHVLAAMDLGFTAAQPVEASLPIRALALPGRGQAVAPPVETALIESVVPGVPLETVELPSRQFTAPIRQSPPMEAVLVPSVLPQQSPLRLEPATRSATSSSTTRASSLATTLTTSPTTTDTASPIPITSIDSVAALAPEAPAMPELHTDLHAAVLSDLHPALLSAPLSAPLPALHATAAISPFKAKWAPELVEGLALSSAATQSTLTDARLRVIQASHQRVDPVTPVVATTLTAQQLEAVPLAGRKWQNFVLDSPSAPPHSAGAVPGENSINPAETTIDGVSTRLAFGSATGTGKSSTDGSSSTGMAQPWASGHGLQVAESAIREVESAAGNAEVEGSRAAGGRVNVTTQQGGPGFHGQGFVFDRQNTWGARNPFTTWVQETALATSGTVPVFTAEPYTPPDHETVWGLGAGSEWKKKRLFWFGAVDRYFRNDPAVAMVRHPYLVENLSGCAIGACTETAGFFAQPSDNQMQVLAARLGLSPVNPVSEGLAAYSKMLETLDGLLGPAPRTASQWVGFGRVDWQAAERNRFTFEGIGAHWDAPGGGLTRVSELYGNHSFGTGVASEELLMARWETFLTPNLLAVTQVSAGRNILATHAETPSLFEQTLLAPSIWGQLPQIVVDSRYGFTIGNPARFGRGSFPDEKLENLQQSVNWIRGSLVMKAGFDFSHNADTTELLRNQTGTYHYANVENFASDALAFASFGVASEQNPTIQHGCDQTGTVWVDSEQNLRGLGNLPCYSYYSQEIGPAGWQMSSNDWAGFATAQWQPAKRIVVSAGLRWEREQLPAPIALLNNPELPLTQKMPTLGNDWGPRISMAIGSDESHWPVLRIGYGMYYSRTPNQVIESALTQTGSFNGDLSFYMRPIDNLNGGGAPPFPYVLAGTPGSVVKPGAVEFAPDFHNPEIHQAVAAVEKTLPGHIQITASAEVSLGRRLPVPIDTNLDTTVKGTITYAVVDARGAGPIKTPEITVPSFYASWPSSKESTGDCPAPFVGWLNPCYQEIDELTSKANSTYEAAVLRVERYGRRGLSFHAHYTYSHAMDWNPGQSPLDPGADFRQEYGTSDLDVRHSAAVIAAYEAPWKLHKLAGKLANGWMLTGIGQFRSGLPYTMRVSGSLPTCVVSTGDAGCIPQGQGVSTAVGDYIVGLRPGMLGSGGDDRVYGIGRNTYRYPATWKADLRLGKRIDLGGLRQLELMAETFNLFNHQNVTEIETTGYYIEPGTASSLPTLNFLAGPVVLANGTIKNANTTAFGQPLNINATDFYRERQIQLGLRFRF
jgi:hypothetical protein